MKTTATLHLLASALSAYGLKPSVEEFTESLSFDWTDGRYIVLGFANGPIGADIYNSAKAFEEGFSPVGDFETSTTDATEAIRELIDALKA